MQNPKTRLEPKTWYRTASSCRLQGGRSWKSKTFVNIPGGYLVMFVSYHPGSVNSCQVMFGEHIGYINVPKPYKHHTHFFQPATE